MIRLQTAGVLATVQDGGRLGSLGYGVGTAGAMDQLALAVGNQLLGNEPGAAAVEMPGFPVRWVFERDMRFALTGADVRATLNGQPLPPWWLAQARRGDCLALHWPAHGSRAYLCVPGGFDVPLVLGSRSTQLRGAFGGLDGRVLVQGDRLAPCRRDDRGPVDVGIVPPQFELPLGEPGATTLRVLPAAEYFNYSAATRTAFWSETWTISSQSNRYGYRLAGLPLHPEHPLEIASHGIVPGVIQVPHGGQPIIQMRDAQPSGGYPKIGTVIEADLWRLGQAPLGSRLRFVQTSYDEAVAALAANQQWLAKVARTVALRIREEAAV